MLIVCTKHLRGLEVSELISSEKSYEEFDKIFTNVYPKFYKILNDKHNLSQTYLRLAAYIRMNQSNNEIAKICGVSMRTVEIRDIGYQNYWSLIRVKI